jgi:DNA-binding beta-propeller fold protein YncE
MSIILGSGKFTYRLVEGWGKLPEGWIFTQVAGVAVDSKDKVYVFNRGKHPVVIFDLAGNFLGSWGEGVFKTPHGIFIDKDDNIYLADAGDHTVRKFTYDGKILMTLGTKDKPGLNGSPFDRPTGVAVSGVGEIYVSDGYGNRRVHRFSPDGKLMMSWGKEGTGPGQFALPHGVFVDKQDRVLVADRENHRIQIFTPDGKFITQWPDFREHMPCTLFIDKDDIIYIPELRQRISILNIKGEVLARWGKDESTSEPGYFFAPHTAGTDSRGDLYIGEVLEGQRIQKFEKVVS